MKVKFFIILSMIMALIVSSIPASVFAADSGSTSNIESSSDYFMNNSTLYDQYVKLNLKEKKYYLTNEAQERLDSQTFTALENQIQTANQNIKESLAYPAISPDEYALSDPTVKTNPIELQAKFKEGVNKIVFHWWGTSVYVKKSTLNSLGKGITIAGIWIPQTLLRKVVASMGVVIGSVPGGMIFDRAYISPTLFNWVRWQ
ncbi:hypothetical protein CWR48_04595 [Oceanobacillus arenosus]|uniref:Uncharacterized protein n=1 Tax=Oceanobacillus arenosus TaxID=1229153 RepID=A0A3D8PZR3_9BACI|nr:hypothetical protein [Oceanobacillus arenosus]RDW20838.1 hypothetical protein CWR48_04595 [Oceanobacillus arenosus]